MKKSNLFEIIFLIYLSAFIFGTISKIMHWGNEFPIFAIVLILHLLFMIVGIREVRSSTKIHESEKSMWIVGFIFLGFITGICYIFSGRKRIV